MSGECAEVGHGGYNAQICPLLTMPTQATTYVVLEVTPAAYS